MLAKKHDPFINLKDKRDVPMIATNGKKNVSYDLEVTGIRFKS